MIKMIEIVTRKAGTTHAEFARYWYEMHAPLVCKIVPGVERYIQNHPLKRKSGKDPRVDGIVEIWLDSLESWNDFYFSDKGKKLRDDEAQFVDMKKSFALLVDERAIIP